MPLDFHDTTRFEQDVAFFFLLRPDWRPASKVSQTKKVKIWANQAVCRTGVGRRAAAAPSQVFIHPIDAGMCGTLVVKSCGWATLASRIGMELLHEVTLTSLRPSF